MFSGRKSVWTIALTVVMMLAMLVPVAGAAPDALVGITIDSPVAGDPAYLALDANWNIEALTVDFTLEITGQQVNDVFVMAKLYSAYDVVHGFAKAVIPNEDLNPAGDYSYSLDITNIWGLQGWYNVRVCAMDKDFVAELFCDVQENAVLIDWTAPKVWLDKPGEGDGAWVNGNADEPYLMVGGAWDQWGLDEGSAVFEYCAITNLWSEVDVADPNKYWWKCGPNDASWIWIADGTPTGVVNDKWGEPATEFEGTWDSTQVPDDWGAIRFCVDDLVGNSMCAANKVFVNNRFVIGLRPGWNLISTPLLPYDNAIASVLADLIADNKVDAVWSYDAGVWKSWTPSGPGTLTTIEDGKGYWIDMAGEGNLEIVGAFKSVGNVVPPEYEVQADAWNLIGYTHWGRPTYFPPSEAGYYLSGIDWQKLYRYDASAEVYRAVFDKQGMTLGAGYWLGSEEGGTIRP